MARVIALVAAFGAALPIARGQPPRIESPLLPGGGEALIRVASPPQGAYRIEASTNLASWSAVNTFIDRPSYSWTDSAAAYFPARFYRVIEANEEDVIAGDHLPTDAGDLVIQPIQHASFVISWNGRMIYVDPVGDAGPYRHLPQADLVLVTHRHGDHFHGPTIEAVSMPETTIVAPAEVYSNLAALLRNQTTVLRNGETAVAMGVGIEAVPAYNLTTSNHQKGNGNGYVLSIAGRRIYISGDTEDIPEMRALADIDVAFVCMNLPYTMSVAKAADATREFQPSVVYPYHFRNQNGTFADLDDFKRRVGRDLGIEARVRDWY